MNLKIRNTLLLFLTAAIWGVAFVAQDEGMNYVKPFTFNAIRCIIGALVLLPVIFVRDRSNPSPQKWSDKKLLKGGVLCGLALCVASGLQQYGINLSDESVGKAGFITAFYIVLVPIAGFLIGKKCSPLVSIAVVIAAVGLYLLCIPKGEVFSVAPADALLFGCALVFTVQILLVDHYSPKSDGVKLACLEFATCGVVFTFLALIFDARSFDISDVLSAWLPILYAGALSCGVAYTLQIVAQKGLNPTFASIVMSFESCISVLAAWMIQGKVMSARQMIGCAVMFAAIVLAQLKLPERHPGKIKKAKV